MRNIRFLLAGAFLLACAAARADVVELTSGGVLEGKVTDLGDSIRIEGRLGSVTLPKAKVVKVVPGELSWEEYPRRAKALDPKDAEGHWRLAGWCRERQMVREAEAELRATIAADPKHERAHLALGHVFVGDKWLEPEEAGREAGMVKEGTEWVTPEEKALRTEMAAQKTLEEQIAKRVRHYVLQTGAPDQATRQEAWDALDKVSDERKSPVLIAVLTDRNPEVRGYAVVELGRMKERRATRGLVARFLTDPVAEVRDMAWQALAQIQDPDIALAFGAYLRDGRDGVRLRAAEVVARFPDLRLAGGLIDALEGTLRGTPIRVVRGTISGQREAGAGVGSGRAGDVDTAVTLTTEGPENDPIEVKEAERRFLRAALKALSGVDFGLRLDMWRFWLKLAQDNAQKK